MMIKPYCSVVLNPSNLKHQFQDQDTPHSLFTLVTTVDCVYLTDKRYKPAFTLWAYKEGLHKFHPRCLTDLR